MFDCSRKIDGAMLVVQSKKFCICRRRFYSMRLQIKNHTYGSKFLLVPLVQQKKNLELQATLNLSVFMAKSE